MGVTTCQEALDREIVIGCILDAPRARVFDGWGDPERITDWQGPDGFGCDTRSSTPPPAGDGAST